LKNEFDALKQKDTRTIWKEELLQLKSKLNK